ncbi:hypothetical protein MGI18_06650 [Bacillus sp. OVS6]|nr:hypothetical protein MGI18_06650 [Bacillus sp. OVS6]
MDRLEAAEKADYVKPYAEALQSAEQEKNNSSTQMKELQQVLMQHKHRYAKIVNSYEQVREKKAAEEPILVARKEQLLQLRELEKDLKNELTFIKELTEKANEASKDLKQREEAAERANELLKKALEKQKALKDQIDQNTVTVQEREQIRMASEQRFHLANTEASLAEWRKRADKKEALVKHAEEQLRDTRQKHEACGTKIKECYGEVQQFYHRSCELLNVHQHQAEIRKRRLLDEKNKAEKQRDQKMAAELAKHLSHGDPCPVCGSSHHPEPAKETDLLEISGSLVEELEKKTAEDAAISAHLQHLKKNGKNSQEK